MTTKPLLKWIGSKTQILDKVLDHFPSEIRGDYHEPFVGSGAVLIGLLEHNRIKVRGRIYAYDNNDTLIYFFKNVQQQPHVLLRELEKITSVYHTLPSTGVIHRKPTTLEQATTCHESYYYWIRGLFNRMNILENRSVVGSAYFLFLNKTCFRGLFRKTQRGGFNVAYGNYPGDKQFIVPDHLIRVSDLIQPVIFVHSNFEDTLDFILQDSDTNNNNFVYLDPPYYPLKQNTFVQYSSVGFNQEQHDTLISKCKQLPKFLMSNSDCAYIRDHFRDQRYRIETVLCKRRINSTNPDELVNEVLISTDEVRN